MPPYRVLFVCLGNICRSPTAAGGFAKVVAERGMQARFEIDSAGTGGWHIGKPPDARAQQAAADRQIDLSRMRARQLVPRDGRLFDYLLAMDRQNMRDIKRIIDPREHDKVYFLRRFAADDQLEIADPYLGGEAGFDRVLELIEPACEGLLRYILSRQPPP